MPDNLFDDALAPNEGERVDVLLRHRNLLIERIVSSDRLTPQEWVQPQDEWVLLARGAATLQVAGHDVQLRAGDVLFLPAGKPHRLSQAESGTIWLAVHLFPEGATPP